MSVYYITMEQGHKVARPILTREEYLKLRGSAEQMENLRLARSGNRDAKLRLLQMNYSCIPNGDGSLKGSKTPSNTVGMDVDFDPSKPGYEELMQLVPGMVIGKKKELGLLMLERSVNKGFHIVFRRRQEMSNEENLVWASQLLGVEFDRGAKDLTRVFFTTGATEEDLLFLDDGIFEQRQSPLQLPQGGETLRTGATPSLTSSPLGGTEGGSLEGALELEGAGGSGTSWRGLPYSSIIRQWFSLTGGEPVEGERNMRLYQLAAAMRAICDNSEERLLAVLPDCGLPRQEMQSIVASACREQPKGITKTLAEAIKRVKEDMETAAEEEMEEADDKGTTPEKQTFNMRKLPPALKASLQGVPKNMQWPVIAAVLPIAAAYADGVEAEYCDGARHRLSMMSMILGEQASGKSVCKKVVDLWKRQMDREDAEARKREDEWKAKRKGRKANEKAPDDPQVLIRAVPVTVSCSTLLKRLKNSRGHTIYSFCEELDTLRKTNGAGSWSSKYDIYRLAFDNGEWGQDYNSDQAESGVVNVAYNWTMLGTYGAMRRCFRSDNVENGLSSRIIVADMPDNSFAPMPHYRRRSAIDEQMIDEGVTKLRLQTGLVDVPRLRKAIAGWVEEKRLEAAKDIDHVKDTYRKRAAVIGFRAGVVCHLLSGDERESKQTVDFALKVAELTLEGQIKNFGEELSSQYEDTLNEQQRRGCNTNVFDRLSPVFTMEELKTVKGGSCPAVTLRVILSRWRSQRWIEKVDKTRWRKLNS